MKSFPTTRSTHRAARDDHDASRGEENRDVGRGRRRSSYERNRKSRTGQVAKGARKAAEANDKDEVGKECRERPCGRDR